MTGTPAMLVSEARAQLLARLRAAHARLRSAGLAAGRDAGLRAGTVGFFGACLTYGAWRALVFVLGLPDPVVPWWHALAAAAAMIPLGLLAGVLRAGRRSPSLVETAERLDLAAGDQNRIAAALDLTLRRCGPFEAAAIEDGLRAVLAAEGVIPVAPPRRPPGRPEVVNVLLGLAVLLAAVLFPLREAPEPALEPPAPGATAPPGESGRAEAAMPAPEHPGERREAPSGVPGPVPEAPVVQQSAATRGSAPAAPGERQRSAGRPGPGKNVEAQRSRQASTAQGEPTEGTSTPPLQEDRPTKPAKTKKPSDPTRMVRNPREREDKTGATAGQSGAGGGAMSPVKSAWSQRDRSADEPLPENPTEENIEDQPEEEEARGGTQPTLKDRRGATSRDLSISGPGEGGEGRGGPSPQKKARGTASLVLGVPVPDFVRGLLNPGTTKVTHERVEPVPSEAVPHGPAPVAPRTRAEPAVAPEFLPPAFRRAVKSFFLSVHAAERGGVP